jgi:hypothetical protein
MNQNTISFFAYQGKANKFKTTESSNPIDLKKTKKNKKTTTKKTFRLAQSSVLNIENNNGPFLAFPLTL